MNLRLLPDKESLGRAAAVHGAQAIRSAIAARGQANIIVATGASQFEMLDNLVRCDLPWHKVTAFHLDEYIGIEITHPASFRNYLWKRFVSRLPLPLAGFHSINAEGDPRPECDRLDRLLAAHPIDVAFVGIGENAHLAFNDPPADFDGDSAYIVVNLDDVCRRQQLGEGWFKTLGQVPTQAISMTISQILKSRSIICSVPDRRKAQAVKDTVEGPVTPRVPASILQQHADTTIYLDSESACLLKNKLATSE